VRRKWEFVDHFKVSCAATIAYFVSFLAVMYIIQPLQTNLLPSLGNWTSLIFLAHGVRVIFIWLFGAYGLLPLFIAQIITGLILFHPTPDIQLLHYVLASGVGALAPWLAFEVSRLSGRSFYAEDNDQVNWRILVLIGLISSGFNSLGNGLIYSNLIASEQHLLLVLTNSIGDTMGTVIMLFLLLLARKFFIPPHSGSTLTGG